MGLAALFILAQLALLAVADSAALLASQGWFPGCKNGTDMNSSHQQPGSNLVYPFLALLMPPIPSLCPHRTTDLTCQTLVVKPRIRSHWIARAVGSRDYL